MDRRQSCIECKTAYPESAMHQAIKNKIVPRCVRRECNGLVKPEIVFFGEALPPDFFHNRHLPEEADLAIVMGTSLTVQPFASLPGFVRDSIPRLLINQEQVGALGSRSDDVLLLGDCDEGVRKLAAACGWLEELEELWRKTAPEERERTEEEIPREKPKGEAVEDEVEKLTKEVEETLKLADSHAEGQKSWLEGHVEKKAELVKNNAPVDTEEPATVDATPEGVKPEKTEPVPVKAENRGSKSRGDGDSDGGGGLTHVYPWLSKSSL